MKNFTMNWRTTAAGIVVLLAQLLPALFPKVITPTIANSISALAAAIGLALSKDGNVTGIGASATTIESIAAPALQVADQLTAGNASVPIQDVHTIMDKLLAFIPRPAASVPPVAAVPAPKPIPDPPAQPAPVAAPPALSFDEAIKADRANNPPVEGAPV